MKIHALGQRLGTCKIEITQSFINSVFAFLKSTFLVKANSRIAFGINSFHCNKHRCRKSIFETLFINL